MKVRTVAIVAAAAMLASSAFVYTLVPKGGAGLLVRDALARELEVAHASPAHFTSEGAALKVDARLGYPHLARAGARENLVLVDVSAAEAAAPTRRVPTSTAIVIDRSGSMSGERLRQAIGAAHQWVSQLSDGDRVSVVTFDNTAQTVVPSTALNTATRPVIASALNGVRTGGSTCLSCGIDAAHQLLLSTASPMRRMLVLSDGHANAGTTTLQGLRQLAQRSRTSEASIVTLGIGTAYSEAALAALAFETNGSHHFVESAASLSNIFAGELGKLASTVATGGEVVLELHDNVELVRLYDRAHRREGRRIVVPLGAFAAGQRKTVLAQVRVRGDGTTERPVSSVAVRFRNADAQPMEVRGDLAVTMAAQRSALDPMVSVRLAKADGAKAIERAARLFSEGEREAALRVLDSHTTALSSAEAAAPKPAARALASARATASAFRTRIQAAPAASARSEVLRSKETATRELE